ncbi:MAG: bifunctional MaoC family dehydratase N-terminal/OB-fold nucleic acid binding domain-containing protein [Acidimicrobiia bacterium]
MRAYSGRDLGVAEVAPDEVNAAMIRHWCAALGDADPIYTDPGAATASRHGGIVAPPTMLQAWVMAPGPGPRPATGGNAQDELMNVLDEAGFRSVVATNCDQEYVRYLRPGDRLTMRRSIESVSEEKSTGLGVGHFVTTRHSYYDQDDELVGTMDFRILKYRPHPKRAAEAEQAAPEPRPLRPRPAITRDSTFWWDGVNEHKLLIQRCISCGELRHPPRPMCPHCQSLDWDTVEASGRGTVYSFVVTHHPQVPAFDYPLAPALIELEEGTRLLSDVIDIAPEEIEIGLPVEVVFVQYDAELTLPQFRVVR